ncbi:MAG: type I-MYXAN CRISPR-associated protein Cas6/Cmx6, partial [Pseudomonadota bacterium]
SPEHSLRMQATGLGAERKLGCGLFIPHKSAAAVGA